MIDQASTTQRRTVSSLVLLLGLGAVFVAAGLAALYQPLEATASDVGMSYLKPSNLPCGHVISIAARGSGRVWAKPTNCGAGWMMKARVLSPCLIWAVERPSTDVSSDAAATDHRKSFSRGIESVNLDAT